MSGRARTTEAMPAELHKSDFGNPANSAETLSLGADHPGQWKPGLCPRHCPYLELEELGAPLTIKDVARLIGCSAWSVRQRHIPQGLPHFRSGPSGKIIFFRSQVVAWILAQQTKGGQK